VSLLHLWTDKLTVSFKSGTVFMPFIVYYFYFIFGIYCEALSARANKSFRSIQETLFVPKLLCLEGIKQIIILLWHCTCSPILFMYNRCIRKIIWYLYIKKRSKQWICPILISQLHQVNCDLLARTDLILHLLYWANCCLKVSYNFTDNIPNFIGICTKKPVTESKIVTVTEDHKAVLHSTYLCPVGLI